MNYRKLKELNDALFEWVIPMLMAFDFVLWFYRIVCLGIELVIKHVRIV